MRARPSLMLMAAAALIALSSSACSSASGERSPREPRQESPRAEQSPEGDDEGPVRAPPPAYGHRIVKKKE